MVVDENGKLGYELTDNGKSIGEDEERHINGTMNHVPDLGDIYDCNGYVSCTPSR